jgi:histone H3/H4
LTHSEDSQLKDADGTTLVQAEAGALQSELPATSAIQLINAELNRNGSPRGFLREAESVLVASIDDFTGELGKRAVKIARDRHATAVDREDVLAAERKLRGNSKTELRAWVLAVAGLAGGWAAAAATGVLLAPSPVKHLGYWQLAIALPGALAVVLLIVSFPLRGITRRKPS